MDWKDKALAATNGSQFGAILHCAFGVEKEAPCFNGKASVTSDGFIQCNFTDKNGEGHWGAFVGSVGDLKRNVEGLAKHLKLDDAEHNALTIAVAGWVAQDWRS